MSGWRLSTDHERWLIAAQRVTPGALPSSAADERSGGWKTVSPIKRCVLFVIGLGIAGLTFSLVALLHPPGYHWIAAALLVAAAEWLIVTRHLFGCGIEEALEVAGVGALLLDAFDKGGGYHESALAGLAALGFAALGWRLLNPLFTTLAVLALSASAGVALPAGAAGYGCFGVGALALAASTLSWRRPSVDRLWAWLLVSMPVGGYLWLTGAGYIAHPIVGTVLLMVGYGCSALLTGLHRRMHAPLLACMVCAACLAYECRQLTRMPLQTRLLIGGCVLLGLALALNRRLREPHRGITSNRVTDDDVLDLLQLAATTRLAPQAGSSAADATFKGGGGGFSGGGSGGDF